MDRRSIVFLTTPTSGAGSLWRLICLFAGENYQTEQIAGKYWQENRMSDFKKWRPEPTGHIYQYNTPYMWPPSFSLNEVRWILNFRDPRDFACNQYYWALQHPSPRKTAEELEAYRAKVRAQSLEEFVLERGMGHAPNYRPFKEFLNRKYLESNEVLCLSYCQLCLGFDSLVERLAHFLGCSEVEDLDEAVELERVENIMTNPKWIGQQWYGGDLSPGRHRRELSPAAISKLTENYAAILQTLAALDRKEYASFYQ